MNIKSMIIKKTQVLDFDICSLKINFRKKKLYLDDNSVDNDLKMKTDRLNELHEKR